MPARLELTTLRPRYPFARFFLALCASIAACDSSTDFRQGEPSTDVPEASADAGGPEVATSAEDADSSPDAQPPEDPSLPEPGPPPSGLLVYRAGLTGTDARPQTSRGVLLAGGGPDNDAAMTAAITSAGRGDAVVLRMDDTGGAYAPYLVSLGAASATELVFDAADGNDSVSGTKLAGLRALADSTYVERLLGRAELVFFAGGNQTKYVDVFRGTRLATSVDALVQRGGVIGGTSAGMHVLSGVVHTPRGAGNSITSSLALRDPYIAVGEVSGTASLEFSPGPFHVPGLETFVLDTHFSQRGRLGRETVFVAREIRDGLASAAAARGLACDEGTAVLLDASGARVFGSGTAGLTMVVPTAAPDRCEDNRTLDWRTELDLVRVPGSNTQPSTFDLRTGTGALATKSKLSVKDGVLSER